MDGTEQQRRTLELRARLTAELALRRRRQQERWKQDPWAWLCDCVWTEDPQDQQIKPFPGREPWAQYLRHVVTLYQDPDARNVIVPKGRRMYLSNVSIALRVWKAAKHPHQAIYVAAMKMGLHENEPGTALELLQRARRVVERLKHDSIACEAFRGYLYFPETESRIIAVASGDDQLRGASATDILMDECAFWGDLEQTYVGARPTTERKGRIWMVSTVKHKSHFSEMRHDRVGGVRTIDAQAPGRKRTVLAEGVIRYDNPVNRCTVLEIYPHADPRKRDPKWRAQEYAGLSRAAIRQEYELDDTDVFGGTPVFDGVYDDILMVRKGLTVDPKRPLLRSWDWGYRHPVCVVGQLYDSRQLRIFAAWMGENIDLEVFAPQVLRRFRERWGTHPALDAGDFAGNQKKGQGPPEIDLMRSQFGITVMNQYLHEDVPLAWLRRLMRETYRPGEPCFMVDDHEDTEELRRALRGGYVLDKNGKPANDGFFEHLGDGLKYLVNFEWEGSDFQRNMDRAALQDVIPEKHYAGDETVPGDW